MEPLPKVLQKFLLSPQSGYVITVKLPAELDGLLEECTWTLLKNGIKV